MKMNTILRALQTMEEVSSRKVRTDDLTKEDLNRLKELNEFESNRYASEEGVDKYNQLLRAGNEKEAFEQGLRIGVHELTLKNVIKLKEMEEMNNKIEVAKVVDNITERAEEEAAKYYKGNEDWRQMTIKNIGEISSIGELKDYLITLDESEQSLLEEVETTKVSPYNKNEFDKEFRIARLRNEIKEIELYREHALNKIKEINTNVKTRRALTDRDILKADYIKNKGEPMMVGERMILKTYISMAVASMLNDKGDYSVAERYFGALVTLPGVITRSQDTKELMYSWAKQGTSSIDIVDRIETLLDEEDSAKEYHNSLTQEHINNLNYEYSIRNDEDWYTKRMNEEIMHTI